MSDQANEIALLVGSEYFDEQNEHSEIDCRDDDVMYADFDHITDI